MASSPPPTAPPAKVPLPEAKAYVLVDVGTGNVLAGYNERRPLPPASLSKVLTALIAVTYLPPGATVTATAATERVYPNRVGMEVGKAWPLAEVLHALLIMSANDAAYAIATRISGQVRDFGAVMARSAAQIGMSDHPVLHDPAGLDGTEGTGGGNLVSARDLAIAGRDLLFVPELARIVAESSYHFVDPTGQLHWLAGTNYAFMVSYPGAIGVKTGFTDLAGACIMAAARRGGRTMLAVVLDGYNPTQTAIDLLNLGFATPPSQEAATDHLPGVALPKPPAAPAKANPRPGPAGRMPAAPAGRGPKAAPGPAGRAPGLASAARRAGRGRGASQALRTWPAELALLASLAAIAYALSEVARANRARSYSRRHKGANRSYSR